MTAAAAPCDEPAARRPRSSPRRAQPRRGRSLRAAGAATTVDAPLALAADAFVVPTTGRPDVVAGYPWFGAWSRDTMTSYEGLFLATGRADEGRELLRAYAATLSEGMLANTADTGAPSTTPPTRRCGSCTPSTGTSRRTGDDDLAAELGAGARRVVDAHVARHPLRHPRRPRRRPAHPGRRRAGADLDGRARRRGRR